MMIQDRAKCPSCDRPLIPNSFMGGKHSCGALVSNSHLRGQQWKFPGGGPQKSDGDIYAADQSVLLAAMENTARRELREETGLIAGELVEICRQRRENHIWMCFATHVDAEPTDIRAGDEMSIIDVITVSVILQRISAGNLLKSHAAAAKKLFSLYSVRS